MVDMWCRLSDGIHQCRWNITLYGLFPCVSSTPRIFRSWLLPRRVWFCNAVQNHGTSTGRNSTSPNRFNSIMTFSFRWDSSHRKETKSLTIRKNIGTSRKKTRKLKRSSVFRYIFSRHRLLSLAIEVLLFVEIIHWRLIDKWYIQIKKIII